MIKLARPPLSIGTAGNINIKQLGPKRWEARCLFRVRSGATKHVRRVGATRTAAERAIKAALVTLTDEVNSGSITSRSRFAYVCDQWHEEIARASRLGDASPTTARVYRGALNNWIIPAMGELLTTDAEISAGTCDRLIKKAHDKRSADTAKTVRSVLSSVCDFAVRHGALTHNPVRSVARIPRGEAKEVRALDAEQRRDLYVKLQAFAAGKERDELGRSMAKRVSVWTDLPDQYEGMLATGIRIGELLAISGDEVDLSEGIVRIEWHIIRVTGESLVRRKLRKGNAAGLVLRVPAWSVPMWRRRKLASGGGALWSAWDGGWLDPSNAGKRLRQGLDETGYSWVTSHVFRKTVAHVIDGAGGSVSDVANQLGNTKAVAERHYIPRRVANDSTAAMLEGMLDEGGEA